MSVPAPTTITNNNFFTNVQHAQVQQGTSRSGQSMRITADLEALVPS